MIILDNGSDEATAISDNALAVLELLNEIAHSEPIDCDGDAEFIAGLQKQACKILAKVKKAKAAKGGAK